MEGHRENSDWFEEWFDSDYYHLLYSHRDESEAAAFMDNLSTLLSIANHHEILDIPCGKGRHSIYLNNKGFKVTGADLSENSIWKAEEFSNPRLHFLVHDMREPVAKERFDFIFNLFTSFGYFNSFEEDQKVIESFKYSVRPGGKIVIDFMNTDCVVKDLVHSETKIFDQVKFAIRRKVEDGTIIKDIFIEDGDKRKNFQERVKALYLTDFLKHFKEANLTLLHTFGNYRLDPYLADSSERMIFVLQK